MTAKCLFNDRMYWLHTSQVNKSDESLSVEKQCKINLCLVGLYKVSIGFKARSTLGGNRQL